MESDRKSVPLPPGLPPLPKSLIVAPSGNAASVAQSSITTATTATLLSYGNLSDGELLLGGPTTSNTTINATTAVSAVNRSTKNHRPGSLSSTLESLSDRESVYSVGASTNSHNSREANANETAMITDIATTTSAAVSTTCTLDTQIALLRREMYGLRQLDLSLLSQLWALNESIQGFRIFLQERDVLSPPSPSPTASDTNSIASDGEMDESLASAAAHNMITTAAAVPTSITISMPGGGGSSTSHASSCSTSGTSGLSSATSSVGKHHHQQQQQQQASHSNQNSNPKSVQKSHPQLPLILQQRMRRVAAPPPPPPAPPARNNNTNSGKPMTHHHHHPHSHSTQLKERPG